MKFCNYNYGKIIKIKLVNTQIAKKDSDSWYSISNLDTISKNLIYLSFSNIFVIHTAFKYEKVCDFAPSKILLRKQNHV